MCDNITQYIYTLIYYIPADTMKISNIYIIILSPLSILIVTSILYSILSPSSPSDSVPMPGTRSLFLFCLA